MVVKRPVPVNPGDKDVVSDAPNIKTQTDRLQGPFLTDDLLAGLNRLGRLKGQQVGITPPSQFFYRNLFNDSCSP